MACHFHLKCLESFKGTLTLRSILSNKTLPGIFFEYFYLAKQFIVFFSVISKIINHLKDHCLRLKFHDNLKEHCFMLKFHDNFKEHRKNDIQVRKTKLQKLTRKLCFNNGKLTIYV